MNDSKIIRKCCSCNELKSRDNLIKITKNSQGEIRIMPESTFFGRSCYICKCSDCVENSFKKGKIFKLLKITPDDLFKEKIRAVLES